MCVRAMNYVGGYVGGYVDGFRKESQREREGFYMSQLCVHGLIMKVYSAGIDSLCIYIYVSRPTHLHDA